jgi:hypothetical protein
MSWVEGCRKRRTLAAPVAPWALRLERVRGKIGDDGIEQLTTKNVFYILEVPQCGRAPERAGGWPG